MICSVITVSAMSAYSGGKNEDGSVEAKTISEIQEERKKNEEEIAALESEINSLEGNKDKEKAYQETLSEQISLIQNNIKLLDDELSQIAADIATAEENIALLNDNIAVQQQEVDDNIELFKERLCAMYVTGSDSLASAILGSTDFYDMLSRVEMVNSIAAHDEELVNNILNEINSLEKSKSDLETEKLTLEMNKETQEAKIAQKKSEVDELSVAIQKSQDEINRIALEQESKKKSQEELEAENDQLQKQEDEIIAAEEAARKKEAEEAERKKEEEERLAAEEARRIADQQQTTTASPSGGSATPSSPVETPVNVPPSASGFAWPAPGFYYISSGYGSRWGTTHRGIDIAGGGIAGASACASKDGTVIAVSSSCTHDYPKSSNCCGNGYGNYVLVSHGDGYTTLYGHLQSVAVSVGDSVSQGQTVGYIGCTGYSTGYHLHFEIRLDGVAQNPSNYVG